MSSIFDLTSKERDAFEIQKERQRQHEMQMKMLQYQMQQQIMGAQTAQANPIQRSWKPLTKADLNGEAFAVPIENMLDLWRIKYGNRWVFKDELIDDAFFSIAAQRLLKKGKLESWTISAEEAFRIEPQ